MPLEAGTRLGPYEILAPLGAGGMGEVYRAKDTRLDRVVAVKVLPPHLSAHPERRQRFEREARAVSSLSHPHICTLFDVGLHEGTDYLVMEHLEGETLAERLKRGPLPFPEMMRAAVEIAGALDRAHKSGIVHRDLKPGNIMLTRSGTKLLDFGLAKGMGLAAAPSHLTASPTATSPLTADGTIVGTFQYMAPEQLEGKEADARSDLFAFGAVLYEMATGTRAFEGKTQASLIAAILKEDPRPIGATAPMTPPHLDRVVRRCLAKDPDDRWQSAHDLAAELQWIAEGVSQTDGAAPAAAAVATGRRPAREAIAWGVAALLAVVSAALGVAYLSRPAPATVTPRAFRATLAPPPDNALIPFDLMGLALSPDGGTLAFVAATGDGRKQIWLRSLTDMDARPLPETAGAAYPFWSPDGGSLGFFADGKLKTIDLRGGSPRVVGDAPTGRGGSWGRDGTILFAPNITSPILRVSSAGGETAPVTTYDPKTDTTHRWPVFLPDGRHFLYVLRARTSDNAEVGRLMLASLDAPRATVLIEDASNALYVDPGYLIYGRSANLYARRFDARALRLVGDAIPIVADKMSYWEAKNLVPFAASDDGTLVFLPDSGRTTEMRWYDRKGLPLEPLAPPGIYRDPRMSHDGRRIVYGLGDNPQAPVNLWVRDLDSSRAVRITPQSGFFGLPIWSPADDRIAFLCQPKGVQDICLAPAGGGSEPRLLYESSTWKISGSWMPDGKRLLFSDQNPTTNEDIMMLSVDGGEPTVVLRTPFTEYYAEVAPGGSRMAYVSNESGRFEVYVRDLDESGRRWQVSTEGGSQARWRADGRELFFAAADGGLMAVPMQSGAATRPGAPVRLFTMPERPDILLPIFEDVTRDGQRFLLNVPTTSRTSIGFHAIHGWTALLRAAAGAR